MADRFIKAILPSGKAKFRDPLGRKEGESLDPLRFSDADMQKKRRTLGERTFGAVWMQDPVIEGAGLLDPAVFKQKERDSRRLIPPAEFDRMTQGLKWVRGWDFAYLAAQYNKPDPDWTVGTKMAFQADPWGQFFKIFVHSQRRWRKSWNGTKEGVRDVATEDGPAVWIGAEGNGPQAGAVQDIEGDPALAAYTVMRIVNVPDPQVWTSRAEDMFMYLREPAPGEENWLIDFFREIQAYPNGAHDDTVSSMSVAYALAALRASTFTPSESRVVLPTNIRKW
jgi:phage terminase large subunit-like protein